MRASSSSSSCNITSLKKRLETIFRKADELSILCGIEVCVIYYGQNGKLKTYPEKEIVKDLALRYKTATKQKKSLNIHEFMEKEKNKKEKKKPKTTSNKKPKTNEFKYPVWYPIFDNYSPNQLSQLVLSLEHTLTTLQERLRFAEAEKHRKSNSVHHQYQTQPLNPNHGDATLSQLQLAASHYNQQLTNYQNHLMLQKRYGFGYFQNPYVSNTQDYPGLLSGQELGLRMQQKLHGFDQRALQHPCLSNTVSDFQKNPSSDMVVGTSYSQDGPNMVSSYDQSKNLFQSSSQPSLHSIPNTDCLPDNSRTL